MQYHLPVEGSRRRYFYHLVANIFCALCIILALNFLYLRFFPGYLKKSEASEAFALLSVLTKQVTAVYYQTGSWPQSDFVLERPIRDGYTRIVETINYDGKGGLHVTFSQHSDLLAGKILSMRASTSQYTTSGNVLWVCGFASPIEGYAIVSENQTTMNAIHLPAICSK